MPDIVLPSETTDILGQLLGRVIGTDMADRVKAEQELLGAILANNRAYATVVGVVHPDDFSDALHGHIYTAICRLIEHGRIANFFTLRHHFETDPALVKAGGAKYLARLENSAVTIITDAAIQEQQAIEAIIAGDDGDADARRERSMVEQSPGRGTERGTLESGRRVTMKEWLRRHEEELPSNWQTEWGAIPKLARRIAADTGLLAASVEQMLRKMRPRCRKRATRSKRYGRNQTNS